MDKYEIFKLQFTAKVQEELPQFTIENLQTILSLLDSVAINYDILDKNKDLIIVDENEVPRILQFYLTSLAIEDKSDSTIYDYKLCLTNMLKAIGKPFNTITTNDLRVYLFRYKEARNVQNNTLEHIRIIIKTFFTWCVNEHLMDYNPAETIRPIKYAQKPREPLDPMELELLRDACIDSREKALIDFLYSTGCRADEVVSMKKEDIDWVNHCAVVLHGKGDKQRTVFLNPESEISLKKYLKERKNDTEYLFTSERKLQGHPGMSTRALEDIIKKIVKRANLDTNKKITPHVFRHTTATVALTNGMPVEQVQKMLGHERMDTTMIYTKVDDKAIQESHRKYVT